MNRPILVVSACALLLSLAAPVSQSAKPQDPETGLPFGNGFPSGLHFNLNLIAKPEHFACPPPEFDEAGNPVHGRVIFFPRVQGDDPISILMESGTKGPKGATGTTELEVTDWCTESFPDHGQMGGDGASLRLPAHAPGYAVYGRITGKPLKSGVDGPSVDFSPDLVYVEDEAGNDLVLLGLIDDRGTTSFAMEGATLTRTDSTTSGKGVRKATPLTGLFLYSGSACYVQADAMSYCLDEGGAHVCTSESFCCADDDGDGVYEACGLLSEVGEDDLLGGLTCPTALPLEVGAECRRYEQEWVFNIGDFVGYLWQLDSTGAYVVQIRFYPL